MENHIIIIMKDVSLMQEHFSDKTIQLIKENKLDMF